MEKLGDRLWIPHQVAYEFSKRRPGVIFDQEKTYDDVHQLLDDIAKGIKQLTQRYPFIEVEAIKEKFETLVRETQAALKRQKERHPKVLEKDLVLETLASLLSGKIGNPYPPEQGETILEEGKRRYEAKIPPGY